MSLVRDAVYALVLLVTSPFWGWSLIRTGKWRTGWKGRRGWIHVPKDRHPRILVHGVSVGETNALAPLVSRLRDVYPDHRIVISATTNTGLTRAKEVYGDTYVVVRFPFDFSWMVDRFLNRVRPSLVVLAELEVWPTFTAACQKRAIPICVVNGRLSDRSFSRYASVRPLIHPMFAALSLVTAQTETYRDRFLALGVKPERCVVAGSLKWDAAAPEVDVAKAQGLAGHLGIDPSRPLIVAGSTGPGEESLLLDKLRDGVQLLLVPRKPERFDEVARLHPGIARRSGPAARGPMDNDVFLLDSVGELDLAYSLADAVFVGRSLVDMGGSNPLESTALGKPTVVGPYTANFQEIVSGLAAADCIVVSEDPMEVIAGWLSDPEMAKARGLRCAEYVASRRGVTESTIAAISSVLSPTA